MKLTINQILGLRVRQLREERHLSQEELAGLSNLHRTYIGQIERAEKNVSIQTIEKIAKAFGITLSELLDFDKMSN